MNFEIEFELIEGTKPSNPAKKWEAYSFTEPNSLKRFTLFADGQELDRMFEHAGNFEKADSLAKEFDQKLLEAVNSGIIHGFINMHAA